MADTFVKFLKGNKADYDQLQSKDSNTLYFIMDEGQIYMGNIKVGEISPSVLNDLSDINISSSGNNKDGILIWDKNNQQWTRQEMPDSLVASSPNDIGFIMLPEAVAEENRFLRADGQWVAPISEQNVIDGAASVVLNEISNSDERLKNNIIDINQIDNIDYFFNDLKPKSYNFINEEEKRFGFIAQEVENNLNKLDDVFGIVSKPKNENDYYNLKYNDFIALNTDQIQKLKKRVRNLEDQVNELSAKMIILESKE